MYKLPKHINGLRQRWSSARWPKRITPAEEKRRQTRPSKKWDRERIAIGWIIDRKWLKTPSVWLLRPWGYWPSSIGHLKTVKNSWRIWTRISGRLGRPGHQFAEGMWHNSEEKDIRVPTPHGDSPPWGRKGGDAASEGPPSLGISSPLVKEERETIGRWASSTRDGLKDNGTTSQGMPAGPVWEWTAGGKEDRVNRRAHERDAPL
jgi:hypothetical protein